MIISHGIYLFCCIVTCIFGYGIFLHGFLTFRPARPGYALFNDTAVLTEQGDVLVSNEPSTAPKYSRLIFVLIDALRSDFVLPVPWGEEGTSSLADAMKTDLPSDMSYVKRAILDNEALAYLSRAHPPTVTMPRIKVGTTNSYFFNKPTTSILVIIKKKERKPMMINFIIYIFERLEYFNIEIMLDIMQIESLLFF